MARDKETLRIQIDAVRPALTALSALRFDLRDGRTLEFGSAGDAKLSLGNGTFETCLPLCGSYERVQPANPTHADLKSYMGMYTSDEAEVTFSVTVQNNRLEIHRRPDAVIGLTPIYKDGFNSSLGFIRFHRDRSGQVNELSVTESRVWNLRFKKK